MDWSVAFALHSDTQQPLALQTPVIHPTLLTITIWSDKHNRRQTIGCKPKCTGCRQFVCRRAKSPHVRQNETRRWKRETEVFRGLDLSLVWLMILRVAVETQDCAASAAPRGDHTPQRFSRRSERSAFNHRPTYAPRQWNSRRRVRCRRLSSYWKDWECKTGCCSVSSSRPSLEERKVQHWE